MPGSSLSTLVYDPHKVYNPHQDPGRGTLITPTFQMEKSGVRKLPAVTQLMSGRSSIDWLICLFVFFLLFSPLLSFLDLRARPSEAIWLQKTMLFSTLWSCLRWTEFSSCEVPIFLSLASMTMETISHGNTQSQSQSTSPEEGNVKETYPTR